MKAPVLSLVLVASAAPFAVAAEVAPGASLDEVHAVLGAPNGQVRVGDRHLVYFERGEIELQAGRVTRVALRSIEEHAALAARDERLRAEQEARRAQLIAEGTALRERKLADAAFLAAPVAYQVSFWENFARSYPGVSCAEPLTVARLRLSEQVEEKQRKSEELSRIAELEARFVAAERRPEIRRVRTYASHHGRRHHQEFGLGPITYTFYDAPLPVYTTPTQPLISPFTGDPAQPERRVYGESRPDRWQRNERDDRHGPRDWRGADRGRGQRRDRM